MFILVKDIDFARRSIALEVAGPVTADDAGRLRDFLGFCAEQDFRTIYLADGTESSAVVDAADAARTGSGAEIAVSLELVGDGDRDSRRIQFRSRRLDGAGRTKPTVEYSLSFLGIGNPLDPLTQFVTIIGRSVPIESLTLMRARLCLTELTMNSVDHASYDEADPRIEITLVFEEDRVNGIYRDNGTMFDTAETVHVDIGEQMKNNNKRGLGLHMLQKSVDEIAYKRDGDWNVTTFKLKRQEHFVHTEEKK